MRVWSVGLLAACHSSGGSAIDWELLPLADGARIAKISVNQGVESVLVQAPGVFGGGAVPPPIIVGRDAKLQIGAFRDDNAEERVALVHLRIEGSAGTFEAAKPMLLLDEWDEDNPDQQITIDIPAARMTEDAAVTVAVRELTLHPRGDAIEEASWSSLDDDGWVLARSDTVKLVIVPIRYQADGSGRLPDTSDEQIASIRDMMYAMYPLEELIVEVHEPVPWTQPIGPFSVGAWAALLSALSDERQSANEPENTYYYGLFAPDESEAAFCAAGCIAGLSNLSYNPADTWARSSIGIGFPGPTTAETLVHEVGHAHGRDHAPCGLGGQASDPGYPYAGASIGSEGYDIVNDKVISIDGHTDIMGYCKPIWTSDYTFTALWERIDALRARRSEQTHRWWTFFVEDSGAFTRDLDLRASALPGGEPVSVRARYTDGSEALLDGFALPYSHIDARRLLVPPQDREIAHLAIVEAHSPR